MSLILLICGWCAQRRQRDFHRLRAAAKLCQCLSSTHLRRYFQIQALHLSAIDHRQQLSRNPKHASACHWHFPVHRIEIQFLPLRLNWVKVLFLGHLGHDRVFCHRLQQLALYQSMRQIMTPSKVKTQKLAIKLLRGGDITRPSLTRIAEVGNGFLYSERVWAFLFFPDKF